MTEVNEYYVKLKPFDIAVALKGNDVPRGWIRISYSMWLMFSALKRLENK
jgi:hypothetical protein